MSSGDAVIWITFQRPGMHHWPNAPEHRAYLRAEHRHLFIVSVATIVSHDNREIEFHDLLEQSKAIFNEGLDKLPIARSCESMARWLGERLALAHKRTFKVDVSEDGECGATVECSPPD